jgi:hypothetical protein
MSYLTEEFESKELKKLQVYCVPFINNVPQQRLRSGFNEPLSFSCKGMGEVFNSRSTEHPYGSIFIDSSQSSSPAVWYRERHAKSRHRSKRDGYSWHTAVPLFHFSTIIWTKV